MPALWRWEEQSICIDLRFPSFKETTRFIQKVFELAEKHNARDTTVRTEVIEELKKVTPRRSQFQPGDEIPERSLVYRWAKKYAFNDFGTYSKHFDVSRYEDPDTFAIGTPAEDGNQTSDLPIISN